VDAARLAYRVHSLAAAYRDIAGAVAMPQAVFRDVISQIRVAFELHDAAAQCAALTTLATRWPDALSQEPDDTLLGILHNSEALPRQQVAPLLKALYSAHWKLKWNAEPSAAWLRLTLLLLETGDLAGASQVASRVTAPQALIVMRADRRFDALVAARPDQFDVAAAASRQIESLAAQDNLKSLELQGNLIEALLSSQRYSAALGIADSAVAEIRGTNFPEKLYDDYRENYRALLAGRARALELLGRWDEAVEQLSAASRMYENDSLNVSDVIDLAGLYCSRGQPSEALAALDRVGSLSSYGSMQEAAVRVDALAQLGDTAQLDRSLTYMRAHRADAPGTYVRALVAANQIDRAARALVARLRSTDQRLGALASVQSYALPPLTARDSELQRRWDAIVARRDVQAAITRVGRIQTYALLEESAAEDWEAR
jgi:beta-barrel assembly-enhancing protease